MTDPRRDAAREAAPGRPADALWALSRAAQALFALGYPLLVVVASASFGARGAALALLAVLVVGRLHRLRGGRAGTGVTAGLVAVVAALLALAAVLDDSRYMLAYPALVNGALLWQFASSLRGEQPIVERFARLQVRDLTPPEVRYCRTVTLVWSGFFVANGTAAAVLAVAAPRSWWATYTGIVSYLLVAALFGAEYVVRKARFGRYGRGPVDRLLAHLLAPTRSS